MIAPDEMQRLVQVLARIRGLTDQAWAALDDERNDRQILLETLIEEIRRTIREYS